MSGNSTVVVTGGSGALGAAVCRSLTQHGLQPIVGYQNNATAAIELANSLGCDSAQIDTSDPLLAAQNIDQLLNGAQLRAVVLCGTAPPLDETFAKLDVAALKHRLEADLFGTHRLLTKLIVRHMKPHRSGVVVPVLSQAMGTPEGASMPSMAGYIMAKYALAGVCAALGADYKWLKVRSVMPGLMDSNMLDAFDERFVEILRAQDRVGTVEPVADEIVNLIVKGK